MAGTSSGARLNITQLVLVPALITLAITILRLVGELQQWSPALFGTGAAGGAGAIVGIAWLPIIFGPYFALKLASVDLGPASKGKAIGLALAGVPVMFLGGFVVFKGFTSGATPILILGYLIVFSSAFVARVGWQALGTTLLAYAFAARIPVLIVMYIAMQAGWKTHYSAIDPSLANAPFWRQFLGLAVLPQMFFWVGYTVVVGTLLGSIVAAVVRRGKTAVQVAA
ncbi:MAG TPA: hypothetical protein VKV95_07210 [Terriglobia bacterium]|nr:hypothetical protein [Terriglobia bacterium]